LVKLRFTNRPGALLPRRKRSARFKNARSFKPVVPVPRGSGLYPTVFAAAQQCTFSRVRHDEN
jgi:hypothetical protein